MANVIYHGPNMHGVAVVGSAADYWCPQGAESDDMPDELATKLVAEQPSNFKAVKAAKTKSAAAQEGED